MEQLRKEFHVAFDMFEKKPYKTNLYFWQGDVNAYRVVMQFTAEGSPAEFADGTTATVTIGREDGSVTQKLAVTDCAAGTVVYTPDSADVAYPGRCLATVELYNGDTRLTSTAFLFDVLEHLDGELEDEQQNVDVLTQLIAQTTELKEEVEALGEQTEAQAAYASQQGDYAKAQGEYAQETADNILADKEAGLFKGEKGDTGPQGPQGEQGPQGPAGAGPNGLVDGTGALSVRTNLSTTRANGNYAVAFGQATHADAQNSFVTGTACEATQDSSVALGRFSYATGFCTAAIGDNCTADSNTMFAMGTYNASISGTVLAVGNGTGVGRLNVFRAAKNGNAYAQNSFNSGGADYAEWFEWSDGNPAGDDRIGYFVTLDGSCIRLAEADDDILGIVSGTAGVVGDSHEEDWHRRFLTDSFGRLLRQQIEIPAETAEDGTQLVPPRTTEWFVVNPAWNPDESYVPRSQRKEWDIIGLMGKLYLRDDGTAVAGGYVTAAAGGIATAAQNPTRWRVLERTGENIVRVMMRG